MSSSLGPNNPATAADDASVGTGTWTPVGASLTASVSAADSSYVYSSGAAVTHYLKVSNFGFAVPSGATINGVVVEIRRNDADGSGVTDNIVKLLVSGSVTGTNKASGASWPGANAYATYGTSSDLWGCTLTDSVVNASNFGLVLSANVGAGGKGARRCYVDHIRITVYYTTGGGVTETFTASGSWVAPVGVTSVDVEVWGGGGAGSNRGSGSPGGGGGGGAYSKQTGISVTPGNSYAYTVGAGGSSSGTAGGDSYFIDVSTVLAKGGLSGTLATGNAGGASASGVGGTKFSGGTGGNGSGGTGTGGGGGSSAGTAANGNNGSGRTAGSAPTGGSAGGIGGASGSDDDAPGNAPGGGGGGHGDTGAASSTGGNGQVAITYTVAAVAGGFPQHQSVYRQILAHG